MAHLDDQDDWKDTSKRRLVELDEPISAALLAHYEKTGEGACKIITEAVRENLTAVINDLLAARLNACKNRHRVPKRIEDSTWEKLNTASEVVDVSTVALLRVCLRRHLKVK